MPIISYTAVDPDTALEVSMVLQAYLEKPWAKSKYITSNDQQRKQTALGAAAFEVK